MKTNDAFFDIVMTRKDEYEAQRTARNKRIAAASAGMVVIAVCVGIGVAALKGRTPIVKAGDGRAENDPVTRAGDTVGQTAVTRPDDPDVGEGGIIFPPDQSREAAQTTKIYGGANVPDADAGRAGAPWKQDPSEATAAIPGDGAGIGNGGEQEWSGGWCIPARPDAAGAKAGVKTVGEKITDAEAKAYLHENTWIGSALTASGVQADEITYSETGYCHVSYDGVEGKPLEVRQNFRDYLAYNDGRLIAIITITKENGKLSATPAFGGPWFDEYDAFLRAHKGEKLLYVYAGWMEIVITPDGKCRNPQGADVSAYTEGLDDPYAYFYSDAATFTP